MTFRSRYSLLRRGLLQRALTHLGKSARGLGRGKNYSARGTLGRGKKERRPLPDFVRFSGRICGSVLMANPPDDLDDFECSFKDLIIEG